MKSKNNLKHSSKTAKQNSKRIIITLVVAAFLITLLLVCTFLLLPKYYESKRFEYNSVVTDYNTKASSMNELYSAAKQRNIDSIPASLSFLELNESEIWDYIMQGGNPFGISSEIQQIQNNLDVLSSQYEKVCQEVYDKVVDDYNIMSDGYNEIITEASIDYIADLPKSAVKHNTKQIKISETYTDSMFIKELDSIIAETESLISNYLLVEQIINPDEEWVLDRLKQVASIKEAAPVTASNDPNGLLNKEGGYTSCIYFTINQIDTSQIRGSDVIAKGTDAGGAIEVYSTVDSALNRCEYLSQFDDSMLDSGSYTIIGTVVVRTSYKLSEQEQVSLTNEITQALTAVNNT